MISYFAAELFLSIDGGGLVMEDSPDSEVCVTVVQPPSTEVPITVTVHIELSTLCKLKLSYSLSYTFS